jgi:hypothetical protein
MRCSESLESSAEIFVSSITEMAKLKRLLPFEERTRAMREGGLKVETMRMLVELTP